MVSSIDEVVDYPDSFYRGISTKDNITSEGYILSGAFQFGDYNGKEREDDYCELSINWNDDEEALSLLLSQKKPNTDDFQFKAGYCILSLNDMKKMFRPYIINKDFSYERRPIEEDTENNVRANPYHGNLLLNKNVKKSVRRMIQDSLATLATSGLNQL